MTPLTQSSIEEAFTNEEAQKRASLDISKSIANGEYDILHFIENMGFALTSTVLEQRKNGTALLAFVLHDIPKDYLDRKQLEFLINFCIDRFKDHHSIIPSLTHAIEAITDMTNVPAEMVPKLLDTFFKNVNFHTLQRGERLSWFRILKKLAADYETELKQMGTDFIYGLISSIDGERDPRNLEFIFKFMPNLIKRYSLLHLAEEMFEIFACYFPIDFTPGMSDRSGISRDDLADKLSDCLVASPEFLEWLVPLALEKLESDLVVAKLDALHLLQKAAKKCSVRSLEPHFDVIWTAIKAEIFPGGDNDTVVASGRDVLSTILERAQSVPKISHNYQTIVLGTILPHLGDVSQRLFKPSTAIGLVCVEGDPIFAGERILNTFLLKLSTNPLSNDINDTNCTSDDETGSLTEATNDDTYYNEEQRIKLSTKPLSDDINDTSGTSDDDETTTLTEATNDDTYYYEEQRIKIYTIMAQLFKIVALKNCLDRLDNTICNQIHQDTISILRNKIELRAEEQNIDLKYAALSVLTESVPLISEENRALIYKVLLQLITHGTININCSSLLELLGALHPIEVQSNCLDVLIRNFTTYTNFVKCRIYENLLPLVLQAAFKSRVLDLVFHYCFEKNISASDQFIGLKALNLLLVRNDSVFIIELQTNHNIIAKLADLALASPTTLGEDALEKIADAISRIEEHLSISEQYIIATEYLSQLKLECLTHLYLAKGLLSRLHQDIILDDFLEWLLGDLTERSLKCEPSENYALKNKHRWVACHLLCSMVNRIEYNEQNLYNLTKIITLLKAKIKDDENKEAVEALAWVAKGLIVCGNDAAIEIIEILTKLLDHPTLGSIAITAFKIMSNWCQDLYLPKVKLLYKQRMFEFVLSKFGNKLKEDSENHLDAFMFILGPTPYDVQKANILEVGPLIFKALESNQSTTLTTSLRICQAFVQKRCEYFLQHLNHIIPSCLQLSKYEKSMYIRIDALKVLRYITDYPMHVLLPYKFDVVLDLASALDDPKRLVRNEAVRTRNAWYLLDSKTKKSD